MCIHPPESSKTSLYYNMQFLKARIPKVVVKVGVEEEIGLIELIAAYSWDALAS